MGREEAGKRMIGKKVRGASERGGEREIEGCWVDGRGLESYY